MMQKIWGVLAAIIIVVLTYIGVYAILPNDKDELSIARSRITAISNPTSGSKNDDHTVNFAVPVGTVFTGTNTEIYSKLAALLPECNSNRMRTVTRQAETGAVEKTKGGFQPEAVVEYNIESLIHNCTEKVTSGSFYDGLGGGLIEYRFAQNTLVTNEADYLNADNNFVYDEKKQYVCKRTYEDESKNIVIYSEATDAGKKEIDDNNGVQLGRMQDVDNRLGEVGLLTYVNIGYDASMLCLPNDPDCVMMNTAGFKQGNNYVVAGSNDPQAPGSAFIVNGRLYNAGLNNIRSDNEGPSDSSRNFAGFNCDDSDCQSFTVKKIMNYTKVKDAQGNLIPITSTDSNIGDKYAATYIMKTCIVDLP